jgi:Bacterial mobilisation protein (MobC)
MARPSANFSERITIRITPEDMARLKRDADLAAVDVTTIARAQFLNAPMPKRKYRRSLDHDKLAEVLIALGRIGTNLNQLSRIANGTGDLEGLKAAGLLMDMLEKIRDSVLSAITR